jgi:hypothetical protein
LAVSLVPASERRFLGVVEVDSGMLIVGDPTYLLSRRRMGTEGLDYEAILDLNPREMVTTLPGRPVLLISLGGDGPIGVFGDLEDGEVTSITIAPVGREDDGRPDDRRRRRDSPPRQR